MSTQSKPIAKQARYFTPDKRECFILGNHDYSLIRFMGVDSNGNPKQKGYADLPAVLQDIEVFRLNIARYGFDADLEIVQKTNLSVAAVKKIFLGYQKRINVNADAGQKTLTVVYYSGHGMMDDNQS